jgi:signal transduction histidine kinase
MADETGDLQSLRDRIAVLEEERRSVAQILEAALSSVTFSVAVDDSFTEGELLRQAAQRLRSFVRFRMTAFYLVGGDGWISTVAIAIRPTPPLGGTGKGHPRRGRNGRVVHRPNRSVTVTASDGSTPILLHAIISQNRSMGLFLGAPAEDESEILDVSFAFLTVILGATAGLRQNAELYRTISRLNDELEGKVRRLEESEHALEEANRSKDSFLANISHEIRTPMSGIIGMGRLLSQTRLDENQAEMTRTILSNPSR